MSPNINRTGAEILVDTLSDGDINVCFANPGTSEMHFVAALDKTQKMRCVLGLFEGVVTGAADGYYRMAQKAAATLLHLGPGLANGVANLHNAKKASSGILNVIGEHATYHIQHNAPLMSDIEGIAGPVSHWVKRTSELDKLTTDAAQAVSIANSGCGQIASLIIPADISWETADHEIKKITPNKREKISQDNIIQAAKSLRKGASSLLLIGGVSLHEKGIELAGKISAKTGCQIRSPIFNGRTRRGAGLVEIPRVPHAPDVAFKALSNTSEIVLCGANPPVSSFAFRDRPNVLSQPDCEFIRMAHVEQDLLTALNDLASELDAHSSTPVNVSKSINYEIPLGSLTSDNIAKTIVRALPENPILIDEAVSSGRGFAEITSHAGPHDWLQNMGGAIGYGMPTAIGAAIACHDRKVLYMGGDGSAMYTEQALWTLARENLDVTILIFANRGYSSLKAQLPRVGINEPGNNSIDMLSMDRPNINWCSLAKGHGVESGLASNLEELAVQLDRGFSSGGPYLIELLV